MNEATLALYREALISQKAAIEELQAAGKSATDTVELDQSMVGRLSRMDALQAQQMAQETARRRQCQLLRIESALRRVDSGDFGYCLTCGDEIVVGRLEFDPTSDRCVGCVDV